MSIVNLIEDKIKAAVNDVIATREDRFLLMDYVDDIIAYVLNRVPPRYITSERGFIHNEIDFSINTQLQADIHFCVDDAIKTLLHRREPAPHSNLYEDAAGRHFYFPYVVGEVLEETTFSFIPDVEVQLLFNEIPVAMIDPNWTNPYHTCTATKGYFLFWPDFLKGEMDTEGENIFKLIFRHKRYQRKEIGFKLRTLNNFNFNKSKILPLTLLHTKS